MRALLLFLVLVWPAPANAQMADDIFGEWWTPGFNARVLIYSCGETACGKITWVWEEKPPDIEDREPLLGRAIFSDLKRFGPTQWGGGRIYNPEDGRSYASNVSLLNSYTLEVNGCVLLFCRRQVWRRFDPTMCPQIAPAAKR
jgi:uncharacterized protein (DUF2147 family)